MKSHARVVVIGGGVVGVSTLYHLAKKGWSDVVLVERKELTSGFNMACSGSIAFIQYVLFGWSNSQIFGAMLSRLEKETGMNVGFRNVSNIRLAVNQDRMDEYLQYAGVASTIGIEVDFLTP